MPTDSRAASVAASRIERKIPMRKQQNSMHLWVLICLEIFLFSAATVAAWAQTTPDFSGLWEQDNERCLPKRNGDVTLHIEHRDPDLTVETSIFLKSPRHAVQTYTTDGRVSISTGTDGDEFHTSVVWKDSDLVFTIEEHEDGRILHGKERWSVLEDGATLERIRERPNGEKQTLFFRRIPVSNPTSKSGFEKARDK
jgi:hypothetical protein